MTKKTKKLIATLNEQWPHAKYAFIVEFRGGTGWSRESRADAIAMNLWPSEGLELIGFEIKTSRADWLKEIKDPLKCEPIKQFCDRWYLVTDERKVAQENEVPEDWGFMRMDWVSMKQQIVTVKEAPKLEPKEIDRLFLASLMRLASNPHDVVDIDGRTYKVVA